MSETERIQSYQELQIWQRGMNLAEQVYRLTQTFPREEMYGITSQMRRAAVSIPANIAEGWGRKSNPEFQRFLHIAMGSMRELETHLILSNRVELSTVEQITPLLEITTILSKQTLTLLRSLEKKPR